MKSLKPQDPRWLGGNRLITFIGRGGMGQVFLGRTPTGRLVAVKQIHRHLAGDPEFQDRFLREVAAGRMVTGAYTAAVLDADSNPVNPWLATEYIPGPDLATVLKECGPLHLGGMRLLAAGLASALVEIHRAGLIHRDLKPGNILLTAEGPRVIDFGIARALEADGQLTATGTMIGSPAFMSPEQAQGQSLSPAADVFSVGAMLAMAATGSSPFAGSSTPQILYRIVHEAPDTDQVPPSLRELVDSCLAKDPAQRPTAQELLAAAGDITTEPVWPEAVQDCIADHRADSDWWVQSAEKQAHYQDQLSDLRSRRNRLLRWAVMAVVTLLVLAGGMSVVSRWAAMNGHPEPMADAPLTFTPEESRLLDGCKLMEMVLTKKDGVPVGDLRSSGDACAVYVTDPEKRDITYRLDLKTLVSVVLAYDDYTGRDVTWMPILGNDQRGNECQRSVITQGRTQFAIRLTASSKSDGDLCTTAEQALTSIVHKLTVQVPLLKVEPDSILRLDPCALLDTRLSREVAGDPAKRTTTPHECVASGGDATVHLEFGERTRPDTPDTYTTAVRLGQYTVYVRTSEVNQPYCTATYLARPTSTDLGEVVTVNVHNAVVPDACERAKRVLSETIPRLPKS